jgi:hypothetical protein
VRLEKYNEIRAQSNVLHYTVLLLDGSECLIIFWHITNIFYIETAFYNGLLKERYKGGQK